MAHWAQRIKEEEAIEAPLPLSFSRIFRVVRLPREKKGRLDQVDGN
jgi:hypothetical protein